MAKTDDKEVQETASPVLPVAEAKGALVSVTITKFGDGKVSTGVHEAGFGDIYAKRGEKIAVSKGTAASLEAKGLAEAD